MNGFWHVFAPIVRWPLHSPRRLFTVLAVVLVAVFVAGEINGDDTAPAAAATGASTPTAEPTSTTNPWAPSPTASASTPAASSSASDAATTTPRALVADDVEGTGSTDALEDDPAKDNASAAASDAAAAFVSAWARPDLTEAAWATRVRPLATTKFWSGGLSDTDPSRTPKVTVTGEPTQVAINEEEGVFDVPTTGPWVRVRVAYDTEQRAWLASSVESVEN